ncbi:hypothetical protein AA313_de0205980 [Arthrobotrys entomopaga]|nr:hypothetical protein AA313_de0205980 [Arthrobotrys entomopaga]
MLGLVEYDSDEDSVQEVQQNAPPSKYKFESKASDALTPAISVKQDAPARPVTPIVESTSAVLAVTSPPPLQGPQGPPQTDADTFGPMRPPVETSYPPSEDAASEQAGPTPPPLSPYSQNRALLRSYTIPNLTSELTIPDSPLTSPPPGIAKQFASFLTLKQKNVHFNQKLSQTTALRNPNLLENLMQHVGMDSTGQYASNWNKEIWNPDPKFLGAGIEKAKGETAVQALARLQKEGFEERMAERKTVEFVGSSSEKVEKSGVGAKAGQVPMSAAERVMSGLDRERKPSPSIPKREGQASGSRREDDRDRDRNRNRDDGRRDRYRDEPDRQKRHRSRSRDRSRDRHRYRERDYGRR